MSVRNTVGNKPIEELKQCGYGQVEKTSFECEETLVSLFRAMQEKPSRFFSSTVRCVRRHIP